MDVGTAGEWAGATTSAAAVITALFMYRRQRRHDQEDRAEILAHEAEESRRRDLDETRRLVYTAIVAHDQGEVLGAHLSATLVNALTHHSRLLGATDAVQFVNELNGRARRSALNPRLDLRRDLQNLIRDLSDQLGEDPKAWDRALGETLPTSHPDDPSPLQSE